MTTTPDANYPELNYFMNESESDVVFIVDGKRVPAIRRILAFKSNVFEAMFSGNFVESDQNEIRLEDLSYEAFKSMIRFIYTEQLVTCDNESIPELMEVLKVADRYQIQRLIDSVCRVLRTRLNLANFETVCKMSHQTGCDHLIPDLKQFMTNNFPVLMQKTELELKKINDWTHNTFLEVMIGRYRTAERNFGPFTYSDTPYQSQGLWVQSQNGQVPKDAVRGGTDVNGEPLYVGRAIHLDDCIPGKVQQSLNLPLKVLTSHDQASGMKFTSRVVWK